MELFNKRVFGYTLGIALGISLFSASFIIARYDAFSFASLLLSIGLALCGSAVLATMVACYRYPKRWLVASVRSIMRRVAKRAIRASLRQATTRVECTGILETESGVTIKAQAGQLQGVANGARFKVYESTGNRLWGIIVAIEVRDNDCDCVPYDRINEEFWSELESRMRTDTSKPSNVHLVLDILEPGAIDDIMSLLDNWR